MEPSRRDLTLLLTAAAAVGKASAADAKTLPAMVLRYDDLPVKTSGENKSRNYFDGLTHSSYHIDMHETELAPGKMPHAAHQHEHEELVMLRDGTLAVTIEGKTTEAGPGSVIYVASGLMHGWKNSGQVPARYFVLALGRPTK